MLSEYHGKFVPSWATKQPKDLNSTVFHCRRQSGRDHAHRNPFKRLQGQTCLHLPRFALLNYCCVCQRQEHQSYCPYMTTSYHWLWLHVLSSCTDIAGYTPFEFGQKPGDSNMVLVCRLTNSKIASAISTPRPRDATIASAKLWQQPAAIMLVGLLLKNFGSISRKWLLCSRRWGLICPTLLWPHV